MIFDSAIFDSNIFDSESVVQIIEIDTHDDATRIRDFRRRTEKLRDDIETAFDARTSPEVSPRHLEQPTAQYRKPVFTIGSYVKSSIDGDKALNTFIHSLEVQRIAREAIDAEIEDEEEIVIML